MSRVAGDPAGKHAVRGPDGKFRRPEPTEPTGEPAGEPAGHEVGDTGGGSARAGVDRPEGSGAGRIRRVLTGSLGELIRGR